MNAFIKSNNLGEMNIKINNKLTTQLKNTIEYSTKHLTDNQADSYDLGIYEGRLALAQELLNYIDDNAQKNSIEINDWLVSDFIR